MDELHAFLASFHKAVRPLAEIYCTCDPPPRTLVREARFLQQTCKRILDAFDAIGGIESPCGDWFCILSVRLVTFKLLDGFDGMNGQWGWAGVWFWQDQKKKIAHDTAVDFFATCYDPADASN
jgi:hypothetical protein